MNAPIGRCRICGNEGKLSFEHVPPKKAFNRYPILEIKLEEWFWPQFGKIGKDEKKAGFGVYTLCEKCNNKTGSWYGSHYVKFVKQAMEVLDNTKGKIQNEQRISSPFQFKPLPVFKQIITMFFSLNDPGFRDRHPYLVDFVLARNKRGLPDNIRLFAFYTVGPLYRLSGEQGCIIYDTRKRCFSIQSELCYPPFGFLLKTDGSDPDPEYPIFEITRFKDYDYNKELSDTLPLPVYQVYTPYSGDFSLWEELQKRAFRNLFSYPATFC
ncbi:hypothetical protein EM20IM_06435 [Candidatus Methylacidiphilum infernorum]|uniref:HNH endonuclease n=1 Tax=Candidatus Methylacidiphilum infernorum TaxID=511746 RepID=A0ABX7PTR3_9BACT|nr:hypothetical protein [Candidatus Methylacidiphilum infernorum]QSR86144.1 hypothetical protein EM20IM_06435 [Candidatus Methylacidiphilum infernorum]